MFLFFFTKTIPETEFLHALLVTAPGFTLVCGFSGIAFGMARVRAGVGVRVGVGVRAGVGVGVRVGVGVGVRAGVRLRPPPLIITCQH